MRKLVLIPLFLCALAFPARSQTITPQGSGASVVNPSTNGAAYWDGVELTTTPTGGAGTLCLTSASGGAPAWSSCAGSASMAWSALSNPSGNMAVNVGVNLTQWTVQGNTGATNLFSIIDTTGNTGTGSLFEIHTVGTSSAKPFTATAKGTANGVQMDNTGSLAAIGTGAIVFTSGPTTGLTGTITNAQLAGSITAAKLVGTDIATVGTITAGTWHSTVIGSLYGGTGGDSSGSTGLAHVAAGTWSYSTVATADIAANAVTLAKLGTQAADTVLTNATGGVAVPSAVAWPTTGTNGCAGASNAIGYNTTTHAFVCNTISAGGLTVGTTSITSGTTTRILFDNAGTLGEYVITGTGNVAMSASPTFTGTITGAAETLSGALTNNGSYAGSAIVPAAQGGSGVANTATHTLGSSNQNWASLGTGIVKNTTTTGAISDAVAADVYGLFSGTHNSANCLAGDGTMQPCSGGGGSANPPFFASTTSTVITMAAGACGTLANGYTQLAGTYTVTHSAGTDTGTISVGCNQSNQVVAYAGASGVTAGNYTVVGFLGSTLQSGNPPQGTYTTAITVTAGVFSAAPTQNPVVTLPTVVIQGSGITVTGGSTVSLLLPLSNAAATNTISGTSLAGTAGTVACIDGSGGLTISGCGGTTGSLTIGTTTITSGTTTRVLFDNAGVVGEYAISGSGNVAMTTSPTFVTPALGTPASGVMTNVTGLPPAAVTSAQGNGAKFQLSTGSTTTNDCVKFDANGNTVDAGSACGSGGSTNWNSIGNPTGNLTLSMSTNASTFNQTSAANWTIANTTAAVIGTSQSSPIMNLCGTAFHAAASVQDCLTIQDQPGNGTDAAITFAIGHTGSSTGAITTTFPGPIQAGPSSGVGGTVTFPEGTAASASSANDVCYGDSTLHGIKCAFNNGSFLPIPQGVASSTNTGIVTWSGTGGNKLLSPSAASVDSSGNAAFQTVFSTAGMIIGYGNGPSPLQQIYTNNTSTGTNTGKVVRFDTTANEVVQVSGSDTDALGVCFTSCGTAGGSQIATGGTVGCVFDNTAVPGDYVQYTAATGDCHDAGSTFPTSGTKALGRATSAGTGTQTIYVNVQQPASSGSGVTSVTCGTGLSGGTITSTGTCSITAPVTVALGGTNATSAGITAFNNITGYTASGATGTTSTNIVFSASPTLTGTITAAAYTGSGAFTNNGSYAGSAIVPVPQGGIGVGTLAAHGPLIGEGTSAVAAASPGTTGQCYLSNGASTDPSFQACPGGAGAGNSVTSVTPVTVNTNTTSDQQLMELSLGAGYFNSSKQPFLFDGAGVYTTQTAQTPTITLKIKLCTISGCGSGTVVTLISIVSTATIAAVTNNNWNLSVLGYTATTGATGNLEIHGPLAVDLGALTTTADSIFVDTNTAVSSNIDLTAALFVDFTIAFSTNAVTANTFTQRSGGVMPFAATAAPVTSVFTQTGAVGNLTGDVTTTNTTATTIAASAVTNSKIANGTIDLTAKVNGLLPLANGGTNCAAPFPVLPKTATYQVLATDFTCFTTITVASGTFTITLVASGTQPVAGTWLKVVNYGSGVVTIARSGQNINGGTASYVLGSSSATNPSEARVYSDGTNYFTGGGFTNPMTTAGDLIYSGTTGLPTRLATGTAKQLLQAGTTPTYIDFPERLQIPAANCNNTTAGAGWSIPSGGSVICRAGTNNLGGEIVITDTAGTFAQFQLSIPVDWDTGTLPYILFAFESATDTTNGHTVIPQIKVSCPTATNGTVTDDHAFAAAHSSGTVTFGASAVAHGFYTSNVQMNSTDMTGCVGGGMMIVQVGRSTDTATGNIGFQYANVTFPRLLAVQAN